MVRRRLTEDYFFDDYDYSHDIDIYIVYWDGLQKACMLSGRVWVWSLKSDWEDYFDLGLGGAIRGKDVVPYAIVRHGRRTEEFVGKIGDWDDYNKMVSFLDEVLYTPSFNIGLESQADSFFEDIMLESEVLIYSLMYVMYQFGVDWEPSKLWIDLDEEFLSMGARGVSRLEWLVDRHGKRIRGFHPLTRKIFVWRRGRDEIQKRGG